MTNIEETVELELELAVKRSKRLEHIREDIIRIIDRNVEEFGFEEVCDLAVSVIEQHKHKLEPNKATKYVTDLVPYYNHVLDRWTIRIPWWLNGNNKRPKHEYYKTEEEALFRATILKG